MSSVFCVSDLHLCDRGPRDNFAADPGREDRFVDFLGMVRSEGGELYVLGDLFDWWQVNLSRSVMAYESVVSALRLTGAQWIWGNHDSALSAFTRTHWMPRNPLFETASGPWQFLSGGKNVLLCHGHEADEYCNSQNPGVGDVNAILSGMLEDKHGGPVDNRGHVIEERSVGALERLVEAWRKVTFQRGRIDEMLDNVEAYREREKCDVVIYGHTHVAGRIGQHHWNCGTWARDRDTFVRIDDGVIGLYEWTKDCKAVQFDSVLRA